MPAPLLILASASSGRLGLLKSIGLEPGLIAPADIDETPHKNELPHLHVLRLAQEKASVIHKKHPEGFVVAADTIATCGRRIIGKAATREEAHEILSLLSGRRHRVYSGVCVIGPSGKKLSKRILTYVKFKRLEKDELETYLDSNEWQGKSGCYGIQSRAGGFIESINGSFSNVVGLPLTEVRRMLNALGFKE